MWPNPQKAAALVTLTEEILYGKLHFLCSASGTSNAWKMSKCGVISGPYLANFHTV